MTSAYKTAMRADIDSDESMSDVSQSSSHTLRSESSSNDGSDVDADEAPAAAKTSNVGTTPNELRNRILMLTSRGVSFRHRHLLADLHNLLPHTFKDTKLDTKSSNQYNATLNALADLHSCNYVFFFEGRKHGQDLYLWLAKAPNGPTIKFSVSNVHTMAELSFGGNCLRGGRGIVVFDKSFDEQVTVAGNENKALIREMLRGVFCVPSKGIRGMKPFVDRVIGIYGLDGKIWIRVYEIREGDKSANGEPSTKSVPANANPSDLSLVEAGPRFVLTPIVILEGSFGGPVIYENKLYVSPNQVRAEARLSRASKYSDRQNSRSDAGIKRQVLGLESGHKRPKSSIDNSTLFG